MKAGITISLTSENESMWINGIKLNALNLSKMLNQIEGMESYILDCGSSAKDLTKVDWDHTKYKIVKFNTHAQDMDIIFLLGASIPKSRIDVLKKNNPNLKIVKYQCGNTYVVDMERVIFDRAKENEVPSWDGGHDETWLIPQQEYQNLEYFKTIYRQEDHQLKVVPFIWDPEPLDRYADLLKSVGKLIPGYEPKDSKDKRISVMEPNMNVVKWSLIPVLIGESFFRNKGKDSFKQFYVGSGQKLLKNTYYKKMLSHLDITGSGKIKFVGRYPVSIFLSSETDVVVSHQWENPLNYAYLDALYYGYPIVHNADFIKDAGYYYPDFNITEGYNQLDKAITEHDKNIDKYKEQSEKVLNRYLSTNADLVDTYKKLIENLFKPGAHNLSHEYDWKTNLYK